MDTIGSMRLYPTLHRLRTFELSVLIRVFECIERYNFFKTITNRLLPLLYVVYLPFRPAKKKFEKKTIFEQILKSNFWISEFFRTKNLLRTELLRSSNPLTKGTARKKNSVEVGENKFFDQFFS